MSTTPVTEAASYAAAFRAAADLIAAEGYDRHAETRSLMGYSVIGALDAAADTADLFSDSLFRAFCGWLVLRDEVTGSDDAGIARWETDRGGRRLDEVVAELRAAADSFSPRRRLADDEVRLVREARDLAATRSPDDVRRWLAATGSPASGENFTVEAAAALGAARFLLLSLAQVIDDLSA